jgi:aldose 1-epimerase
MQIHRRLTGAEGSGVAITWGQECRWVQVHTADHPDSRLNRLGSAVEPMTCPPDAFNSGRHLITLPIGGSTTVEWQITGF